MAQDEKTLQEIAESNNKTSENLQKASEELADAQAEAAKKVAYSVGKDKGSKTPATNSVPGAQGYNPNAVNNFNKENSNVGSSSLPKNDGLDKNQPNNNSEDNKNGKKETAPDMGKDYGDGLDSNDTNTNNTPNTGANLKGTDIENFPDRQNPVQNQLPNQTPQNEQEEKQSGLEKKNDLEDGKEKEKKPNEDKNGNGAQTPNDGKNAKTEQNPNQEQATNGNGYGALKNNKKANGVPDSTERARQNLEHSNKVKNGEQTSAQKANNTANKKSTTTAAPSPLSNLGSKLKNSIKGRFNRKGESTTSRGVKPGQQITGKFANLIKSAIKEFLKKNPWVFIIVGVIFIILFAAIADEAENGSSGRSGSHCSYDLKGVTSVGSVKLDGLQVELVNCDATASNYTVLETVDFEKYVLGVALAEIGPSSSDEAIKTQIVAARGFSLTRNSGMCPGNPDGCFYGYNASTGKIRMRACENDQVYWDYEKDIYRYDRGSVSLYSPEVNSGTLWKAALNEQRKAEVLALAEEVKGKVLVDSNNNVISTNYVASVSEQFISLAAEGKTYDQILQTVYADKGASGFSNGQCTSYGNIDYGDYVLSSDGHQILHTPLNTFLESKGTSLDEFNALISSNVQKAGYGTRAGVVAAAVTLIAELGNNYNVKVPYYWGGGHYDGVVDGALGYWGSTQCHTYANGQSYNYCGLDCSGFVPWAIKNGGFNIAQMLAGDFQYMAGGQRVSLSSNSAVLQPGDILESSGHVVLVVGVDEAAKQYICAEASGNSSGVLFTRRSFSGGSGYWGVKMDEFYETRARS